MKVGFKTLKGAEFELELAAELTVADTKKAVAEYQGNSEHATGYRLIYAGKILKDADTLEAAGVSSTGRVVAMPPAKAKPASSAATSSAAATTATASPSDTASKSTPAKDSGNGAATSTAAETAPVAAGAATSGGEQPAAAAGTTAAISGDGSLLTGAAFDASIRKLCDMGFPEEDVKKAMRAAFNNPDRAVEYLLSGIPETAEPEPTPVAPVPQAATTGDAAGAQTGAAAGPRPGTPFDMFAPAPAAGAGGGAQGPGGNAPGGAGSLDFLRHIPNFNLMRRVIQANPAMLPQLLAQLSQANPELVALINANQAEFVRLINEPLGDGEDSAEEAVDRLAAAMAGADAGGAGMAPRGRQIVVSPEENEQIERLSELGQSMGLERAHVVEAWLACDRDEHLAANYLVNNMEELKAAQEEDAAAEAQGGADPDPQGGAGDNPPS